MIFYLIGVALSAQFAVLFAGSNTYWNYRHQADIFTIYGQLLARGFTTKNIHLYAYDDIATVKENPYQGQVFHSIDHKINVYPGSDAVDFKGKDINSKAFYDAVSKLPTSSDDYVFIYYDDHGGYGTLGTPDMFDEILVDKLAESFDKAAESKLYKQCLFMIEACYSGSIGENITAPNLAIITAANDKEESFAAVYDEELGAFLSNEFTNYFISYIDEQPEATIGEVFLYLKNNTEHSHACYFGDESMQSLSISTFIGKPKRILTKPVRKADLKTATSREATEKTLKFLSEHSSPSVRARAKLQMLRLKALTERLETVLDILVKYVDPKNCDKIKNDRSSKISQTYLEVFSIFREKFGEINPDDFGKFNVLVSLAATHSKEEIIDGISAVVF
ncbi:hypothetical protein M9Y10_025146 [Tritrichomonas musculus]|uniref:Clan CD, family C13, asparaginyl endopeptidase-like cysteine peptidase n=1 Tax=Tritrichomonas musculus TaxID=1915356 RepID=A0ABR2HAM4_9EUKA